jgi:glutamine synthetase
MKSSSGTSSDPFVVAEYIWVSGADTHHDIRSKVRTLPSAAFKDVPDSDFTAYDDAELVARNAKLFPTWSFDGSSTNQALCCKGKGENTEIIIQPKRVWPHPFPTTHSNGRTFRTFVVLCECFLPDLPLTPTDDNTRVVANQVFDQMLDAKPWFALEQEYVVMDPKTGRPYKWPAAASDFPAAQGPYYCSNGTAAWGREIADAHYAACLSIGVRLSGLNAEVMPAQWEYQVGPCTGIEAGDHAIAARWLLVRVAAMRDLDISFHAKPIVLGDWNGSGMHTNYSTEKMRQEGGIAEIKAAIARMQPNHVRDILVYGDDNYLRLSGKHETSDMKTFSSGVGVRHCSIRIPVQANAEGCGYFEDRRPSASADPYLVIAALFASSMGLKGELLEKVKDGKVLRQA